ncbi:hypothetical protein ACFY2W_06480 [Streptomyces sp. NPDC001262]|uniref:Uncharacterized protein n=1 Tax=Streptomyces morookaense TaxID=1970 RepID=A0A7Y7B0R1_STRMO|nr:MULTISPECIES: hypothetical protein [Streptomyces]MCC2275107.1 hypothetical protein [Streptomyces sp. ET3-23]NVK76879.1 hypothetical protein [Streptomyces morookaense]GHF25873.1 hypothetical protein GCM10010359_29890 [Streptomyces morookaense]
MLDVNELEAESAELLPGREALGKLKFDFFRQDNFTTHMANVDAHNQSDAVNICSPDAIAQSEAMQGISISQ